MRAYSILDKTSKSLGPLTLSWGRTNRDAGRVVDGKLTWPHRPPTARVQWGYLLVCFRSRFVSLSWA